MMTVNEAINKLHNAVGKKGRLAFFGALAAGIITHMSVLTSDIPNHDGLSSMYFDQNMITSGRWFLGSACGISSYYSLPWLIGILAILYISMAAMAVRVILNINNPVLIVLSSVILAVFPGLASNFAYVFTMDGYMLGMLLCVLSVFAVEKSDKYGWIIGGVLLAFGMGCYQSYICIAMLLCLFKIVSVFIRENNTKSSLTKSLNYIAMGGLGVFLYYILLKVLLKIQGKELDTYQGINGMSEGNGIGFIGTVKLMYKDFVQFTFGKVFVANVFCAVCLGLLLLCAIISLFFIAKEKKLFRRPLFYVAAALILIALPCIMNAILVISANVTYHVLMRYQWAFLIICMIAVVDRICAETEMKKTGLFVGSKLFDSISSATGWIAVVSLVVVSLSYIITDNISYSNLHKKYEKTYSYCLRLADRIEQTPGYYEGIPVAMVGVVGNDSYPLTDITGDVTGGLLGINGDYLLYKSENYGDFFKHYLGITFNMVSSDEVINFYDEPFYAEMESFPGETSVVLHDGIIYVKTENIR
ncbi:MAG: glucosyltransferase domain-containing protein [Lachnospiraceae bacterium]|nr:glucosyltransferase domain-containing protein [Lachnospiraceae bacterium]